MNKVSVVVPIYNAESYLEHCVLSLINQTYSNIEILLINDGSSDESLDVCYKMRNQYTAYDIKVYSHENRGVSYTRNFGINKSNGEFILFVDPDDFCEINMIEILMQKMDRDTDITCCCCYAVLDNKKVINYFYGTDITFTSDKEKLYRQLMRPNFGQPGYTYTGIGVPWGKLYRRSFLKKFYLMFPLHMERFQDNIFNTYAFFYAREIIYVNQPLYNYNVENIKKYNNNNYKKLENIFDRLVFERKLFVKKTNSKWSTEVNELEKLDQFYNYVGLISIILLNSDLKFSDKRTYVQNILSNENVKSLLEGKNKFLHKKSQIVIFYLLKFKLILCLNFALNFRYWYRR